MYYCIKLALFPFVFNISVSAGHEIVKKLECYQHLFWQSKNILTYKICPFRLAIQIIFGVPVPHVGLPFGTLHAAISHPGVFSININYVVQFPFIIIFIIVIIIIIIIITITTTIVCLLFLKKYSATITVTFVYCSFLLRTVHYYYITVS